MQLIRSRRFRLDGLGPRPVGGRGRRCALVTGRRPGSGFVPTGAATRVATPRRGGALWPSPRARARGVAWGMRLLADETGSATAEYAVATMAAVGFAGLLVLILRGDEVRGILTDLVRRALTVAG